jgi:hypothetical protein
VVAGALGEHRVVAGQLLQDGGQVGLVGGELVGDGAQRVDLVLDLGGAGGEDRIALGGEIVECLEQLFEPRRLLGEDGSGLCQVAHRLRPRRGVGRQRGAQLGHTVHDVGDLGGAGRVPGEDGAEVVEQVAQLGALAAESHGAVVDEGRHLCGAHRAEHLGARFHQRLDAADDRRPPDTCPVFEEGGAMTQRDQIDEVFAQNGGLAQLRFDIGGDVRAPPPHPASSAPEPATAAATAARANAPTRVTGGSRRSVRPTTRPLPPSRGGC